MGIKVTAIEPGPFRTDFLDGSSLHVAAMHIDDYVATGGSARTWAADNNQGQEGDPQKAAKIIVNLAGGEVIPQRIQLGANAIYDIAEKLQVAARDQQEWREIGLSADF